MKLLMITGLLTLVATMAEADPATIAQTAKGATYVDAAGMTLYTFAKDGPGTSACEGTCAKNWPPFAASASDHASGEWTVIQRSDGLRQWAYEGHPLYTWIKDAAPGDITGDGFLDGAWQVAQP
ncbi:MULTISPECIES: hypothetical protein [Gemmobacter]|uniref:Lipoprotein with Yx(FWY)xxD motif n=1 Tax=Gemmobacter nanjingensis TaxID=488454 RepID=A0ABQ3FI09_9RHOB|nr:MULTISPECIES: hypothetical protein [Gemmobacter]GHC25098.1 hypothetical protein GCM10007291_25980 [Gemmobacter nanjingensis]